MRFEPAPDIDRRIKHIVKELDLPKVKTDKLHFFRSYGSSGRATARIWSLPTVWQMALSVGPGYCIEVVSERYDRLSLSDQEKVLIHELLHIPKNFTGGLVPHRSGKRRHFSHYHREVDQLFDSLKIKSYEDHSR